MSTVRFSGILLASLLALAACGGKKKPITPDETASTGDGGTDMPATDDAGVPMTAGGDDAGAATPTPEKKPPPALALPAASAKITVKKKPVEVKSDGTVSIGGKPAGKLSGADMQDPDGKTLFTVGADNAVMTPDGSNLGSFSGDDLTLTTGDKYTLADDGNLSVAASGGKPASWGKATGVGSAKRALILAAYVAGKADATTTTKPTGTPPKKTPPKGKK